MHTNVKFAVVAWKTAPELACSHRRLLHLVPAQHSWKPFRQMSDLNNEYRSLTKLTGFVTSPEKTLINIRGKDRRQLLHSFCTADIKGLEPGQLTEAFVLNEKGKILSHVLCLATDDEIMLLGMGQQTQTLMEHLISTLSGKMSN